MRSRACKRGQKLDDKGKRVKGPCLSDEGGIVSKEREEPWRKQGKQSRVKGEPSVTQLQWTKKWESGGLVSGSRNVIGHYI